jgi:hypothetical protein
MPPPPPAYPALPPPLHELLLPGLYLHGQVLLREILKASADLPSNNINHLEHNPHRALGRETPCNLKRKKSAKTMNWKGKEGALHPSLFAISFTLRGLFCLYSRSLLPL